VSKKKQPSLTQAAALVDPATLTLTSPDQAPGNTVFVQTPALVPPRPASAPHGIAGKLELSTIRPSPTNPRKTIDGDGLRSLADSIQAIGLLQPIVVRPIPHENNTPALVQGTWTGVDHFQVIAGERRLKAAAIAGLTEIPAVVRFLDDTQTLLLQLVENDQREDVRPSEQAAAYARLAATGHTAAAISEATGKPIAFVRQCLRLARLPQWALRYVDDGTLPRSTAELVSRIPGEESRERAVACVLLGYHDPAGLGAKLPTGMLGLGDRIPGASGKVLEFPSLLTFDDTKHLIREHYTRELKGSCFDRKSLDLIPSAGSCEACPKCAKNDPEATADGVRADTCLDPECYRSKVAAHDAAEIAKGTCKGALPQPDGFRWRDDGSPPPGWCRLPVVPAATELAPEFAGHRRQTEKLSDLLGIEKNLLDSAPVEVFAVLDVAHKLQLVVRTADARKALQELGVLKKPEKKPREKPSHKEQLAIADKLAEDLARETDPVRPGPGGYAIDERACLIAGRVLREYGQEQTAALSELPDAGEDGPIRDALCLIARSQAYEMIFGNGSPVLREIDPRIVADGKNPKADEAIIDKALCTMTAPQLLGLLLQFAAALELREGPNRSTSEQLLAWAELDWPALQEQARRELTGGEPVEEKIAAAEAKLDLRPDWMRLSPETVLSEIPNIPEQAVKEMGRVYMTTLGKLMADVVKETQISLDSPPRVILTDYFEGFAGISTKRGANTAEAIASYLDGLATGPSMPGDPDYPDELPLGGPPRDETPPPSMAKEKPDLTSEPEKRCAARDCPADIAQADKIADYRARQKSPGGAVPAWGQWSEFEIAVNDQPVRVLYDPAWLGSTDTDHFEFHGTPISPTGYRSHFAYWGGKGKHPKTPFLTWVQECAEEIAAEFTKKTKPKVKSKKGTTK
jgi:ParB/RepB/Spo0J family partition protein